MKFVTSLATSFAIFFTALVGARLLTRYLLSRGVTVGMNDLIEIAIGAAIIALGATLLGRA
ncbi:hypothetical protein PK98_03410 [Croceibacterium mercuriale]|uniref:Uncharacterized protein n=1 Tax=Croceibacterium mercuriale TaxID=1572751 RepID=A0A0B2BVR6_9SPHN|nr:hypothetical protein [Croceibacterium mercuriale]KHL25703.1 hypothetical protein PK98_03410 [Croceibacterium mercuriale]